MCIIKIIGLLLISASIITPFAAHTALDRIPSAAWTASLITLLLGLFATSYKRKKRKSKKGKALASSIAELADAIEDKTLSLDATTKAIYKDLHVLLTDISNQISDGDAESADEAIQDIIYDLERIIYPNGMTEKQAEALANRSAHCASRPPDSPKKSKK